MDNPSKEKMTWSMVALMRSLSQLSHALVTKIATLQLKQQGLNKVIPSLLKGYTLATEHHLMKEELSEHMLHHVDDLQNLNEQLDPILHLLDVLNHYGHQMVAPHHSSKSVSIQECLSQVMTQIPFTSNEQHQFITIDIKDDFEIKCPSFFVETVLYHLITYSLNEALKTGKGGIHIKCMQATKVSVLSININTDAVESQNRDYFEYMIYEPHDSSRPGLGLCRLALLYWGGDITYQLLKDGMKFKLIFLKA